MSEEVWGEAGVPRTGLQGRLNDGWGPCGCRKYHGVSLKHFITVGGITTHLTENSSAGCMSLKGWTKWRWIGREAP